MAEPHLEERPRFDVTAVELVRVHAALKNRAYAEFKWDADDREKTVWMCAEIVALHGVDVDWEALSRRLDDDLDEERRNGRDVAPDYYDDLIFFAEPESLREACSGDGAPDL